MSIYFNKERNEVTDVKYLNLPDYPCKSTGGSAINCEGRSIFLCNDNDEYNKLVYELRNGVYHALPSLNNGIDGSSVCYINKQLVVNGRYHIIGYSIETFRIDVSKNDTEWKTSQSSLPIPLQLHKSVVFQNKIIITGGVSNGNVINRAWEGQLSPANKFVWKEIGKMNYSRFKHFLFSFENKVIVFGGNTFLSNNENDRVEFLEGESWKLCPNVPFNFDNFNEQCVLDRQGRIIII